jgi:pSer/pThr/pTyr-binding forkhead associated (FHA) protein
MICKICNAENDHNAKFCIGCGSQLLRESTKVCTNGHIYSSNLTKCPFCPSPDLKKQVGINNIYSSDDTATFSQKSGGGDKTKIMGGGKGVGNKTVIVGSDPDTNKPKMGRKLIGWLVSFTRILEGEDFKIYEGRNLISSSNDGDIIINDPSVSSPHCMILFRNGIVKVKDELSTNGTFINGNNIDEEELKDGDLLKVGKTELKFRTV